VFLKSPEVSRDKEAVSDSPQPITILLVEDEDRVRGVMELTLTLSGYHVISTGGAVEALEVIENYKDTIHLMVTDFAMPHMNGGELAARLKRVRPSAKVLYVSGFPEQDIQDFHGMKGRTPLEFLQKPFSPETLEMKVHNLLADVDQR
jgi:two-component system, cell cycle sensor histidine kinase and response regulator CckA